MSRTVARLYKSTILFLFLFAITALPVYAAKQPTPEEEQALQNFISAFQTHLSGLSGVVIDHLDARLRIAKNLYYLNHDYMSPERFYKELAYMKMPEGKEQRWVLMEVKKSIDQWKGNAGLEYLFGLKFPEGGSEGEMKLLKWRREFVKSQINQVIAEFKGRNLINGTKFSVFYAEVGSWTSENPKQMKLAGDIDFNFVSGNLELAMAMKMAFDRLVRSELGFTSEAFDAVCTVHGMATDEVFIGKHGQAFAESLIKEVKEIDFDNPKVLDQLTSFELATAMQRMFIDAALAKVGLPNLPQLKWPMEPGVSLEMLRHFEHDIVGKNVFNEIDSFIKAAKYMERSDSTTFKQLQRVSNPELAKVCDLIMKNKKRPQYILSKIIHDYYKSIGKELPVTVQLMTAPVGKGNVTLELNQEKIRGFWDDCHKAMWDNARMGFEKQLGEFRTKIGSVSMDDEAGVKALFNEMDKLHEQVEIEMRVLTDPNAGIHEIPDDFSRLVGDFRDMYHGFMQNQNVIKCLPIQERKSYKFIDAQLKARQPSSIYMAMAALLDTPERVNSYLDIIDDTALGYLRGERGDWVEYLKGERELCWAKKVDAFLERKTTPERQKAWLDEKEKIAHEIEDSMSQVLFDNCVSRKIRDINTIFGRSVQTSRTGQAMMKTLMVVNLAEEVPVYINYFYEGEWSELATEFFRRRVPGGNVVESLYMGRYCRAVWDTTVTFIPPLALGEVAVSIGTWAGQQMWDTAWAEELNKFIDGLYDNAEFKLVGIEVYDDNIKLGVWKLVKVTYNGEEFTDLDEFIMRKRRQIQEMKFQLGLPAGKKDFPIQYCLDGITDWIELSSILRENIVTQDPFVLMIDEMKQNPNVGEKLKERYFEMYMTRFEELKLGFVIHMIDLLEHRKAAEQAELSGQLPKMIKELDRLTKELEIYDDVQVNLEKEMGGTLYKMYAWICDWLKGVKREFQGEAEVWTHYQDCVRIIHNYLSTYKKIYDARKEAEEEIYSKAKTDFGLRLLTGPFFLKGKASRDGSVYSFWRDLRSSIEPEVRAQLVSIKAKYVDTGGTLNTDKNSFDQKILGQITDHDLWREVWKYVFSDVKIETWSPWHESWIVKLCGAVKAAFEDRPDWQEFAKDKHRYHKEQRDRLLKMFEEHYLAQKGQLFEELEKLVANQDRLANEACLSSQLAEARIKDAMLKIDGIANNLKFMEGKLKELELKISQASKRCNEVIQMHAAAEDAGVKVADSVHRMEPAAVEVCAQARALKKSTDDEERESFFEGARLKMTEVKDLLAQAKQYFENAKSSAEKAQSIFKEVTTAQSELKGFSGIPAAYRVVGEAERILAEAQTALAEGQTRANEIEKIQKQAYKIEVDIQKLIKPIEKTEKGKGMQEKLDGLKGRQTAALGRAKACVAAIDSQKTAADGKVKDAVKKIEDFDQKHQELLQKLESQNQEILAQAAEKSEAAGSVLMLGESYFERAQDLAMQAALCYATCEDRMGVSETNEGKAGGSDEEAKPEWANKTSTGETEEGKPATGEDKKPGWAKGTNVEKGKKPPATLPDKPQVKGEIEIIKVVATLEEVRKEKVIYSRIKNNTAVTLVMRQNGKESTLTGAAAVAILMQKGKIYFVEGVGYVAFERERLTGFNDPLSEVPQKKTEEQWDLTGPALKLLGPIQMPNKNTARDPSDLFDDVRVK